MRNVLNFLVLIGLFSCRNSESLEKYSHELPDSVMINKVIESLIQVDSMNLDYDIRISLRRQKIYKQLQWHNDSVLPPLPLESVTFEKLFQQFKSDSDLIKRKNDSIFFCLQSDTSRHCKVSKHLCSKFNRKSNDFYLLYLPIFSFDKQFVFIQYWRHCGNVCGDGHRVILNWNGKQWIKIGSWVCGKS